MKNKYAWGRWLALLGIGVAATLLVYLTVDEAQLVKWFSRYGRFLVGAVLVSLIVLAIVLPRRKQVRLDLQLASKERGLEPPKPEGKPEHRESRDAWTRAIALRDVLVDRHGWCWRYRDRWVLVAGDTPLVKRSIIHYALACPEPETRTFIAKLRAARSALLEEVEEDERKSKEAAVAPRKANP